MIPEFQKSNDTSFERASGSVLLSCEEYLRKWRWIWSNGGM